MAETKARFLANLIGADNTANDFTLPNTAVSGTNNKVLTSGGDGTVTWELTELSPATTSISPTEVASDAGGNITFTLTGTNYALSGMAVTFLANSGSNITSNITVNHGTSTSFTVTVARSAFVNANEPYSVKVTKASGLDHTLSDAVRVDNAPSFTASPNTVVATVQESIDNATHATIAATDAEGDTITFSEVGTTLYNEFTSATPRGVQSDGTIKGVPDAVTTESQETTFTVRATSTGNGGATTKTTDQAFKFVITPPPLLFTSKIYTGDNSASRAISFDETYNDASSTNRNFQPDLIWVKNRDSTNWHAITDTLRGVGPVLYANDYGANDVPSTNTRVLSIQNDGYTFGNNSSFNTNGNKYVTWAWKAGGTPVSISDTGNATSITQSASSTTGLSITKFTGPSSGTSGTTITIPHNLGGTPEFILYKNITNAFSWLAWHTDIATNPTSGYPTTADRYTLHLNTNASRQVNGTTTSGSTNVNNDAGYIDIPTSTNIIFSPGNGTNNTNYYKNDGVIYAFKSVSGVSKFGVYTGNGTGLSSEQAISNVGFVPRFLIIKGISSGVNGANWHMVTSIIHGADTTTTGSDYMPSSSQRSLAANNPAAESSWHYNKVETYISGSNKGFKVKTNDWEWNANNETYIYMAFA